MSLQKASINLITIISLLLLNTVINAQTFTSPITRVNLVELYTSEGCSSCPPADRWLNALRDDKGLWSEFIPLAFHVDYWDYIGWQDPFANKAYSQRQRRYAEQRNIRSVYTPGIILNGKEWRGWSRTNTPKQDKRKAGILRIELNQGQLSAHYDVTEDNLHQALTLNIVLLGFNQSSSISAGENQGKKFTHNFVVLSHHSFSMSASQNGFTMNPSALPSDVQIDNNTAITAWVSTTKNLAPLQAVGGWLK